MTMPKKKSPSKPKPAAKQETGGGRSAASCSAVLTRRGGCRSNGDLTEWTSRRKSQIEDAIVKAAKALKAAHEEVIIQKIEIGRLAYDYKAICSYGEYEPLIQNLGMCDDTVRKWRTLVYEGNRPPGHLYRKSKNRLPNAKDVAVGRERPSAEA
jgi:hypothetical protein